MNTIGQMRWRLALVIAAVVSGLVVSTEATAAPLPWSSIASTPAPRGAAGATSLHDGLIYVVGGLNVSGAATSTLYVYDPATNRWSQKASAPVPLNKPNVVGSGGRLYVLGSRNRPRAAYRYDPVANIWSAFAAPPGGRTGFITGIGQLRSMRLAEACPARLPTIRSARPGAPRDHRWPTRRWP